MAKKYYAVKRGKTPGIYDDWEKCRANVSGFSGAIYKGFENMEEAREFLKELHEYVVDISDAPKLQNGHKSNKNSVTAKASEINVKSIPENETEYAEVSCPEVPAGEAVAYVDGSYDIKTGAYSFGAIIFHDGEAHEFSKKYEKDDYSEMRNVAGEIKGASFAMQYCVKFGIKKLKLYYDYAGIEMWATGAWKRNKEGTRLYYEYCRKIKESVDITFVKVKGHSGDRYNDRADRLAKDALGIK